MSKSFEENMEELEKVVASVGLGQNLAALRF